MELRLRMASTRPVLEILKDIPLEFIDLGEVVLFAPSQVPFPVLNSSILDELNHHYLKECFRMGIKPYSAFDATFSYETGTFNLKEANVKEWDKLSDINLINMREIEAASAGDSKPSYVRHDLDGALGPGSCSLLQVFNELVAPTLYTNSNYRLHSMYLIKRDYPRLSIDLSGLKMAKPRADLATLVINIADEKKELVEWLGRHKELLIQYSVA